LGNEDFAGVAGAGDREGCVSNVPSSIKIYHIVHVDRLASILSDGCLYSDAALQKVNKPGTSIGMTNIKARRLTNSLTSVPDLCVGQCVPFYFCPRSVMLYLIHKRNTDLAYQGGQDSIVHLRADLGAVVDWANRFTRRWAFTLSNAGSSYFEDRCNLDQLNEIDWDAVNSRTWMACKDSKQAEFLLEHSFPVELIEAIGVFDANIHRDVSHLLVGKRVPVQVKREWYY
jgi:ssDNA thymidine ADP-ribosyltransferase, DarT